MHSIPPLTLQPQAVQHACQVTEVMRKNVQSGETPFRRAYIPMPSIGVQIWL
jgi:hypothetical protein